MDGFRNIVSVLPRNRPRPFKRLSQSRHLGGFVRGSLEARKKSEVRAAWSLGLRLRRADGSTLARMETRSGKASPSHLQRWYKSFCVQRQSPTHPGGKQSPEDAGAPRKGVCLTANTGPVTQGSTSTLRSVCKVL